MLSNQVRLRMAACAVPGYTQPETGLNPHHLSRGAVHEFCPSAALHPDLRQARLTKGWNSQVIHLIV
jgi:hypothetical protein